MDAITQLFEEEPAPTYPGSKTVLKSHDKKPKKERVSVSRAIDLFDPNNWGFKPLTNTVNDRDAQLYTFGALCAALDRPQVTVRLWETHRDLPPAPFRAEHIPGKGGTTGRRYYPLEAITACLEEFHKRGLLGESRIEWSKHADLTEAISQRWMEIVQYFNEVPNP